MFRMLSTSFQDHAKSLQEGSGWSGRGSQEPWSVGPKLAKFTCEYSGVILELIADDSRPDIVTNGFDTGVRNVLLPMSQVGDQQTKISFRTLFVFPAKTRN
jgi:hypothetical protein